MPTWTCTLVDEVLTCWPPGPPERTKVKRIALSGIAIPFGVLTTAILLSWQIVRHAAGSQRLLHVPREWVRLIKNHLKEATP